MMLFRLSGHSGAGKSRLTAALRQAGVDCPRAILYTSRPAREGEVHGKDYYFLSRAAIAALPGKDFFIGPVRDMLQAVDLVQLEADLGSSDLVLIEIFDGLWPGLVQRLGERTGERLRTASVFLTAIDPEALRALPDDAARSRKIEGEVQRILTWRKQDPPAEIEKRARSAVQEVLRALGPEGATRYSEVLHSAPEGPHGQDEWTRARQPVGRAAAVLARVVQLLEDRDPEDDE